VIRGRPLVHTFCTYFDRNYLSRGLALHRSLAAHCDSFVLWVLCLDDDCFQQLDAMDLRGVRLLRLADLERAVPGLADARPTRSAVEYYFTCTPALMSYVLARGPVLGQVTYLDADTFFYGDPAPVFDEIGERSIAIVAHRYPAHLWSMHAYGTFNVGWITVRRDEEGSACVGRWLEQCIEWCYDRIEGDRYADQKYLDEWPSRYGNLVVLRHKGVNVAPWNLMNHVVSGDGRGVWIDERPLVLFHFHGFKQKHPWVFDTHTARYGSGTSRRARTLVFQPYIAALGLAGSGAAIPSGIRHAPPEPRSGRDRLLRAHRLAHYGAGLVRGQYLLRLPRPGRRIDAPVAGRG